MIQIGTGLKLDDRYELKEQIGHGGMALVYRAVDHRTGHDVAVKILKPEFARDQEFLERFDWEAAAASKMTHHNIVNLLDVGQVDSIRYLVMEYVRGKTLKQVIEEKAPLPYDIAGQIAIRILSALQHAHNNGIIHRDIKPQNILVHSEGHIKVADFGIARIEGDATQNKNDSVMGSVYYFSPEQASGQTVTAASDIYSVGVVLYEMLTGTVPFDGDTPVAVALQHVSVEPRPVTDLVPGIPASMERIVRKAMEKKPEKRYQSAMEMAQDLHRALHDPQRDWSVTTQTDVPIPLISQVENTHPNNGRRDRTKWMYRGISALLAVMMALVLIFGVYKAYDMIFNVASVPYLINEYEDKAVQLLVRSGLTPSITRTSDAEKPAGAVIMQDPGYDVRLKKGDIVYLTVSTGPVQQEVPDLSGKTEQEAREILSKVGFNLLVLPEREVSREAVGTVVRQSPRAGEIAVQNGIIQVALSGGCVLLQDLTGYSYNEALGILEKMGVEVKDVKEMPISNEAIDGTVASQQYLDKNGNILENNTYTIKNSGAGVLLAIFRLEGGGE
ncbi:MAG: Stk1 family PASTA domain-containing Ser/Thr kinase [Clostridia bacterium]|nr:Stk1 family PASTA domain-containing Ser/Thr kinase [Clostridia bacterium]